MSIRKCKRKFALCIASLFWAACGNDSSSNANIVANAPADPEFPSSSESFEATSSDSPTSSADAANPSSSDAISPESSSAYVNPDYPYTLGIIPSVHCKDSTYYIASPCPSYRAKIKANMASIQDEVPLYGIQQPVCAIPAQNAPIFACDNGAKYSKSGPFILEGNTILQCAPESSADGNTCPSAEEYYKKRAEESEASTDYPYKLAQDSSINCKTIVTAKLMPATNYPDAVFQSERWDNEIKYKCEDGNTYEYEDILKSERGSLYMREETEN